VRMWMLPGSDSTGGLKNTWPAAQRSVVSGQGEWLPQLGFRMPHPPAHPPSPRTPHLDRVLPVLASLAVGAGHKGAAQAHRARQAAQQPEGHLGMWRGGGRCGEWPGGARQAPEHPTRCPLFLPPHPCTRLVCHHVRPQHALRQQRGAEQKLAQPTAEAAARGLPALRAPRRHIGDVVVAPDEGVGERAQLLGWRRGQGEGGKGGVGVCARWRNGCACGAFSSRHLLAPRGTRTLASPTSPSSLSQASTCSFCAGVTLSPPSADRGGRGAARDGR
jgi:hypothetical protein